MTINSIKNKTEALTWSTLTSAAKLPTLESGSEECAMVRAPCFGKMELRTRALGTVTTPAVTVALSTLTATCTRVAGLVI